MSERKGLPSDEELLGVALNVASKAGEVILAAFRKPKRIATKSSATDLVTETDKECEQLIISGIRACFPDHKFIAEESHSTDGVYDVTDDPTWIIDPIDGTNNFVHSLPLTCVSIGVMVNRVVRVGVVHLPVLGETFHAVLGKGSFLNGSTRLSVSGCTDLQSALVATEFGYDRSATGVDAMLSKLRGLLLSRAQSVRMLGCAAVNMSFVAAGRVDVYYEGKNELRGPKPWDVAAGSLIVTEAGGLVKDTTGDAFSLYTGRVLAASSGALAEEVLKHIAEISRKDAA